MLNWPGPLLTSSSRPPTIDRIWKKSYLAKSLCGWCGCSYWEERSQRTTRRGGMRGQGTHSPKVVDKDVEDAEDDDEQGGAELGLEANHNHDTGASAEERDDDAPQRPLSAKDEADEEKDEQHAASKLKVHLAVLFVDLGQAGKGLGLAHPRVGEHHEQAADDGQVAEEEVEVKDEAVTQRLGDDDGHEAGDGVVGMLPDDDENRARHHCQDVDNQEQVRDAVRNCFTHVSAMATLRGADWLALTVSVVVQVEELVAPLRHDAQRILEKGHDNQETTNCREIAGRGTCQRRRRAEPSARARSRPPLTA